MFSHHFNHSGKRTGISFIQKIFLVDFQYHFHSNVAVVLKRCKEVSLKKLSQGSSILS